ncbi:hypothetical protein SAMN02745146_3381 [Hymenobacter daecheongensis DSM 21074]|uniref:Uncharacterized protein n=1 Tax=Hymenobacter daecheongensis DSM 21074 TaxID=1121955 RepID=A0A1M6K3W5_9BACT|nr:hypothetical protein [Hymenobacter daecheongensis]SHJ53618.1 hypothetical protein SAMN02745146_3381 [Hymenobacter daecheongensis DSM 21074]
MAEYALFVPECNVDTALTLSLVAYRYTFVSHRQGIGQVARVLKEQGPASQAGRVVVGMVDRDKKFAQAPELAKFRPLARPRRGQEEFHEILQHPELPNEYLIVLNPACDTWLFRAAAAAGLDLAALGLPAALPAFIDFCKQENVEEHKLMRLLLHEIQRAQPIAYRDLADFVAQVMNLSPAQQRLT